MSTRGVRARRLVLVLVGAVAAGLALAAPGPLLHTAPPVTPTPTPVPLPAGWVQATVPIAVGHLARGYLLIQPEGPVTARLPVVVDLQGCCTTPEYEATRSAFYDASGPAVLVYPTGYDGSWNAGLCCHQAQADHVDDVGFLTAVVDRVLADQPDADPARVYLVGYSNGGRMALRMACEAPGLFAAVASVGAVVAEPCPEPAPVPLLEVAGTADPELTLGTAGVPHRIGTYLEPTVYEQVARYRLADGCPALADTRTVGGLTTVTWGPCRSGGVVRLALYDGVGHIWPVGDATTPSATSVVLAFLLGVPGTGARGAP